MKTYYPLTNTSTAALRRAATSSRPAHDRDILTRLAVGSAKRTDTEAKWKLRAGPSVTDTTMERLEEAGLVKIEQGEGWQNWRASITEQGRKAVGL